jgi:hypothetical protein
MIEVVQFIDIKHISSNHHWTQINQSNSSQNASSMKLICMLSCFKHSRLVNWTKLYFVLQKSINGYRLVFLLCFLVFKPLHWIKVVFFHVFGSSITLMLEINCSIMILICVCIDFISFHQPFPSARMNFLFFL